MPILCRSLTNLVIIEVFISVPATDRNLMAALEMQRGFKILTSKPDPTLSSALIRAAALLKAGEFAPGSFHPASAASTKAIESYFSALSILFNAVSPPHHDSYGFANETGPVMDPLTRPSRLPLPHQVPPVPGSDTAKLLKKLRKNGLDIVSGRPVTLRGPSGNSVVDGALVGISCIDSVSTQNRVALPGAWERMDTVFTSYVKVRAKSNSHVPPSIRSDTNY